MAGPPRSPLRLAIEKLDTKEWIDSGKESTHHSQDAVGHLCRKVEANYPGREYRTHRDMETGTIWVTRDK